MEHYSDVALLGQQQRIEILKDLAKNLDPFIPMNAEMKSLLSSLGIEHLDNPYLITNQLILKIEEALLEQKTPPLQ